MKKILLIVAIISLYFVVLQGAKAGDTLNPCWKLIWEHQPEKGYTNPDSVVYDTCKCADTLRLICPYTYAKRYFEFFLPKGALEIPLIPRDSIVPKNWQDIDTNFNEIRNALGNFEKKFGKFYIYKIDPANCDTNSLGSRYFHIGFNNYVKVDSIVNELRAIQGLERVDYDLRATIQLDVITEKLQINEEFIIKINTNKIEIQISEENFHATNKANIFNILGETILSKEIENSSKVLIDISHLLSGIYFIKVGKRVQKFYK